MKLMKYFICTVFILGCFGITGFAQKTVKIQFAKGKSEAVYNGVIKGYDYADFTFSASVGQKLKVLLTTKTSATVFDVSSASFSLTTEQAAGSPYEVELPANGIYTIRVMMMRSQARRKNSIANFKLTLSIN